MRILLAFFVVLLFASCDSDRGDDGTDPMMNAGIKISVEDLSVNEGNENNFVFVRLILSGTSTSNITANISSRDDQAVAGEDFVGFENVPVVIPAGSQVGEYRMELIGDEISEIDERFSVEIINVEGASIADGTGIVNILNDESSTGEIDVPSTGFVSPDSYPGRALIWQDEFNGDEINESFWSFEIGTGSNGWGNNELQYYRKENARIYEGNLVITAKDEPFNGRDYTSTRMITKGKFDFTYGRVDIRANLPTGQGIWPALWMLGDNISTVGWPACGETDIMEIIGSSPNKLHGTIHWSNNGEYASFGGDKTLSSGIFNDNFHVFSIEWDTTSIRWYLDGEQYHVVNITSPDMTEFHLKNFFIFNVAVGGNWPGSPNATTEFPQMMIVDYIRVFQ